MLLKLGINFLKTIRPAIIFFGVILSFNSCVKQEEGDFKLEYRMRFELPASANPLLTHVFEQRMGTAWIQFLLAHDLENEDIRMIRPRSVYISPVFDNPVGYELISEARAEIYDPTDPGGITPIADLFDPIGDPDELFLIPGLADVKELIFQPEFVMRLELKVRVVPASVSEHFLTTQFDVFLK